MYRISVSIFLSISWGFLIKVKDLKDTSMSLLSLCIGSLQCTLNDIFSAGHFYKQLSTLASHAWTPLIYRFEYKIENERSRPCFAQVHKHMQGHIHLYLSFCRIQIEKRLKWSSESTTENIMKYGLAGYGASQRKKVATS